MKQLSKLITLVCMAFCLAACSDDSEPQAPITPTPATLNGTWSLAEWNGQPANDDWYIYITFDRLTDTYVMYQRQSSMKSEKKTGSFAIAHDEEAGTYTLSGTYDYTFGGVWAHDYIITDLQENTMTLTMKDEATDVQKYVRVESVPEDILKGTRSALR